MGDDEIRVLAKPDASKQTTLQKENIPDEMDAEQTFPTEDEIKLAREDTKKSKLMKRVPKGMSDYQACWIPDVEEVEEPDEDDEDDMDNDDGDENDESSNFMSCKSDVNSDDEFEKSDNNEEFDDVSVSEAPVNDDKYDLGK